MSLATTATRTPRSPRTTTPTPGPRLTARTRSRLRQAVDRYNAACEALGAANQAREDAYDASTSNTVPRHLIAAFNAADLAASDATAELEKALERAGIQAFEVDGLVYAIPDLTRPLPGVGAVVVLAVTAIA